MYTDKEIPEKIKRLEDEAQEIKRSFSLSDTREILNKHEARLVEIDSIINWVKYHISDIANGMNMKIENIEYLAAVHLKEGQPHVHIMWWDIQQQVLIISK